MDYTLNLGLHHYVGLSQIWSQSEHMVACHVVQEAIAPHQHVSNSHTIFKEHNSIYRLTLDHNKCDQLSNDPTSLHYKCHWNTLGKNAQYKNNSAHISITSNKNI